MKKVNGRLRRVVGMSRGGKVMAGKVRRGGSSGLNVGEGRGREG